MEKTTKFSEWLLTKLKEIKMDESVFLDYILSIVEGEETRDEKLEILQSVLIDSFPSEAIVNKYCSEILDKWQQELLTIRQENEGKASENLDQKLARLLEANVQLEETTQACKYTEEELKIREAILSKYSHADDLEDEDNANQGSDSDDLEKNVNAITIQQVEKEKREKAKLENQKKKERDKMERDKQKLTQQEKKEARRKRAQKVEHHRK